MEVKTRQHWKKLKDILKADGFLTMIDYDYQITRARHPILNWFLEDVEYLKEPPVTYFNGDNCRRKHITKHYTAIYEGGWGRERLVGLQLK